MHNRTPFKFFVVALITLLISACSSTPEKVAEPRPFPTVSTQKPYQPPLTTGKKSEADLWQHVRNNLAISDYKKLNPEAERHLQWFLNNPQYVADVVERARPYLYYISSEVSRRGMPMEVALLPVVESGYKPYALSSSRAAGLWQFIPVTGQIFGLEQNWWYDGRRDVIESTRAALDYLQKLHSDFGDWQLALAAYNSGEGTVSRAVKRNRDAGKPTDFWSLDLPSETSAYVPKLMAVSHLVKYPGRYNIKLSPIANKPYIGIVDVGSQIDLAKAAKMARITEDELHHLNPAFNQPMTPPDGPHQLVLPLAKIKQFKQALAALPSNQRTQMARHEIKRGETLNTIASHYNTSVDAIRLVNELEDNQIRTGSHLLIPTASAMVSNHAINSSQQPIPQTRSIYTVKPGDTWWNISRAHQVDIMALTQWNNTTVKETLQPGQKLVLMLSQKPRRKSVNYTIKSGDSLTTISRKFNVSVAQVREWNGLTGRNTLHPGQNLTLYLDGS